MKVLIQRDLSDSEVADIAITAVEQAIGYWGTVRAYDPNMLTRIADHAVPECFALDDDAPLFEVRDALDAGSPTSQPLWYIVTPRVIAQGIQLVLQGVKATPDEQQRYHYGEWQFEPRAFADMDDFGAMDADEADWVIQLGLFGKLVYA